MYLKPPKNWKTPSKAQFFLPNKLQFLQKKLVVHRQLIHFSNTDEDDVMIINCEFHITN